MRLDKIGFVNSSFTTDLGKDLYKDGSAELQYYAIPDKPTPQFN